MRMTNLRPRAISVFFALALLCGTVSAQIRSGEANLDITVKDPSGALINNARLVLLTDGKPEATTQTNQKGEAHLAHILPGASICSCERLGRM